MTLGNYFPPNLKRASVIRRLVPGVVIKICALMDDGLIHEKRFLIVHIDENTVACVINSDINPIILNNPARRKCQVAIDAANHSFMDRDSHIDCSKIWQYPTDEVISDLEASPDRILGVVVSSVRDQAVAAIKHSPLIRPILAGVLCASLESANLE